MESLSSAASESSAPLVFEYARSADPKKRSQRELIAENAVVTYEGRNFGEDVAKGAYK